MRVLITGANGHLGQQLIKRLAGEPVEVIAAVRSEAAVATLKAVHPAVAIRLVEDQDSLAAAANGCDAVVHLVGIIKESRQNSFGMAHEQACTMLVNSLSDSTVKRILHLGIIGADPGSANACFKSRGAAEQILLSGPIPATVIRLPMVLGQGDAASMSLARQARASCCFTFRAGSLEQPIDSDDVIEAILACLFFEPSSDLSSDLSSESLPGILELAGPESLPRSALIRRAARCLTRHSTNRPIIISLPISLGYCLAALFELVSRQPPVTRAMLGVLDHDDQVDPQPGCKLLGLQLAPLDETLHKVLQE